MCVDTRARIDRCQYRFDAGILGRVNDDLPAACCAPVLGSALGADDAERLARVFKVLADPVRLRLLSMIAACPEGTACACDLVDVLGRSQPTISHHLKTLYEAGLLDRWREGSWIHYRVRPDALEPLHSALAPTPEPA